MAKDRRKKASPNARVNLTQVVSSGNGQRPAPKKTTTRSSASRTKSKKKQKNVGKIVLTVLMLIVVAVGIAFVVTVLDILFGSSGSSNWPDTHSYDTTPEAYADKVSYYMVGVLGEESDDDMMMVSVICHDKKAGTMQIMEIPRQTYLGNADKWSAETVAGVWADPIPLKWCETCRKQVFEPEITDGKHNVKGCDTDITMKTGSSVENLMEVSNDFLGLPIDQYFILPKEAVLKLVNLVGGIDVELDKSMKVGDISYKAGIQTIDGEAAIAYMEPAKSTVTAELEMMTKRRQVMFALFERLRQKSADAVTLFEASDEEVLKDDIITPLQYGSTPIRTELEPDEIVTFLADLSTVEAENVTVYTLPGEATIQNKVTYFTVHLDEMLTLLNKEFNPYGETITQADIVAKQIDSDEKSNVNEQTMAQILVPQTEW